MTISDEFRRVIAASGFFYGRNLEAVHAWCERVAAEAGGSALDVAKFATARRMMLQRDVTAQRYKAAADGARAVEQEPARKPLATAKNPAASVKPIDWAALVNTLRLRC